MGVINRAVLQGEIMQALNALFANGQVGRTETHKIVIFPETTVSFSEELNAHVLPNCVLVEGKEYSVTFNGETSHPTASKVEENGSYYIEISNLVDGDGYQVMYVPSIGSTGLLVMKGGVYTGDVTISITTKDKTIHPIDQKFLPGVCLPVVELTTMIPVLESSDSGSEASLSDVENNALNNAVGLPCVIKCSVGGTLVTGVFTYLPTDTVQSYMLTFASLVVNIHKDVDVWEAYAVLA